MRFTPSRGGHNVPNRVTSEPIRLKCGVGLGFGPAPPWWIYKEGSSLGCAAACSNMWCSHVVSGSNGRARLALDCACGPRSTPSQSKFVTLPWYFSLGVQRPVRVFFSGGIAAIEDVVSRYRTPR